jgi:hypothetical protein
MSSFGNGECREKDIFCFLRYLRVEIVNALNPLSLISRFVIIQLFKTVELLIAHLINFFSVIPCDDVLLIPGKVTEVLRFSRRIPPDGDRSFQF